MLMTLLIVLLLLLLRNILKLYADRGSALGARLRTRMVLGAALIALMPAVLMFLFSFQLMNRSIDRWFSPNTSELRDDSNRVVQDWGKYLGDATMATTILDRLMHRCTMLEFKGKTAGSIRSVPLLQMALDALDGKDLPVPKVPWLKFHITTKDPSGGVKVDVIKLYEAVKGK